MRRWFFLVVLIVIGFLPSRAFATGALAVRIEAALAARRQAQATTALEATAPAAAKAARPAASDAGDAGTSTSAHINVADWLNHAPALEQSPAKSGNEVNQIGHAATEPAELRSSRRQALRPGSSEQESAPEPPVELSAPAESETATTPHSDGMESAEVDVELAHPLSHTPTPWDTEDASPTPQATDNATDKQTDKQTDDIADLLQGGQSKSNAEPDAEPDGAQPQQHAAPELPEEDTQALTEPAEHQDQEPGKDQQADVAATEHQPRQTPETPSDTARTEPQQPEEQSAAERGERSQSATAREHAPADPEPAAPKKHFSRSMLRLRDQIRSCLAYYYQRPEKIQQHSPWGMIHYLIAYGVDAQLQVGRDRVNAIGWLCYNRPCRNIKLFAFDGTYPVPRNGPGYQGHEGQFLSILALSRVKATYPMRVDGHELTVQDLIEYEKATCRPRTELTFKLIGLAHYLPSDATWTSKWGEKWTIPRLIQEELAQPINGACCGGTHRLIGYSMAFKVRQKRNEPLNGQWLRAHGFVDSYHKHAVKLQNRDGSFSTNWFKGRAAANDLDRRVQTTGHILEWLVFSLPEEELTDPRIVRAVHYLNTVLLNYRRKDWDIAHRGHALRALALYNERVFGDKPGQRADLLAKHAGQ